MQLIAWHGKREWMMVVATLLLFVAIRLPGLSLPYHQDEWKTGEVVRSHTVGALSGQPPLMELIYQWTGALVGSDNLRITPLFLGVVSAMLLYLVVRRRAGIHAAYAALALYTICMYGVFASLMIDTDGVVLPTLLLIAVYAYDRLRAATASREIYLWLGVVAVACIVGLLAKLSAVLIIGALVTDYFIERRHHLTRALVSYALLGALGCVALAIAGIANAHLLIPSFHVGDTITHVLYYVRFEGRGYLQILIQAAKAFFYLSPLLLVPLALLSKESFAKSRVFFVYLGLAAFFFFVLFDFSQGALDKYLMFTIVPLAAIVGTILADKLRGLTLRDAIVGIITGVACATVLFWMNFLSPSVVPLYPKTAWIHAIAAGNWNILFPFTGGDGPIGVYISFLVLASGFVFCGVFALVARFVPHMRKASIVALIVVGVAFNGIFIEEFLFGRINGSAPDVLRASLAYIAASDEKDILTHADTGSYELVDMGKRAGRFYAVPGYEEGHKALFAKFTGNYLVVDVPLLNEEGFYRRFFNTCRPIFTTSSGVIKGYVYDCAGSDPYAIQ